MKKIYKYDTVYKSEFNLLLPKESEILTIQIDNKTGRPCFWALIDHEKDLEERYFKLITTGEIIFEDKKIYLGTYQKDDFVGHLFELIKE